MQSKLKTFLFIALLTATTVVTADTFTHKESGESFDGFRTQKSAGGRTRIYDSNQKQMVTLDLSEYTVEMNQKGRKDVAIVVAINASEALLSEVVAKEIAQSIIDASNRGTQAVIVHIDSPGGRGDYMKLITSAIEQTDNCPVVAYISAEAYGGAFSAAAVIAMACDKIYIDPTATIGTIGPMGSLGATPEDFSNYMSTYCSKALILHGIDMEAERLAETKGRPGLIARALIDKALSIIEVTNVDGSHQFIEKDNHQPTQTIVRTLSEGVAPTSDDNSILPVDAVRSTLKLMANEAIEVGLADATAGGYYDILSTMNLQETKINYATGIKKTIKKYQAARRTMGENLARINWLEKQVSTLEDQVAYIDEQLRTSLQTREVRRGTDGIYQRSSRSDLPTNYDQYYYDPSTTDRTTTQGITNQTRGRSNGTRSQPVGSETVVTMEPTTRLVDAQRELTSYLEELANEYQRAVNLAKRWPGSLPPEIPRSTLERNIVATRSSLDFLYVEINAAYRQGTQQQQRRSPRSTGNQRNRY